MMQNIDLKQTPPPEAGTILEKEGPCCSSSSTGECRSGLSRVWPDGPDEVCCGSPPGPRSSPRERPGYQILHFVHRFLDTPVGAVPAVRTDLAWQDRLGTIAARLGVTRNDYTVAPGLYAAGIPGSDSPVLVTANYKLSFDTLRRELGGINAWLLILDTRGINVWCAAGKQLFSTDEVVYQVQHTRLDRVVSHRRLVLPQLGATGVAAHEVRKRTGFSVTWGPVRTRDIAAFLRKDFTAEKHMRRVDFPMRQRLVLIPVELSNLLNKKMLIVLGVLFLLAGIGPGIFSISAAWSRWLQAISALALGIAAGTVMVPALLPWLPGRSFALKGGVAGAAAGLAASVPRLGGIDPFEAGALFLAALTLGSFLGMNFTGSTPYTSPSGVEKEMRRAIPLQAACITLALGLWLAGPFI